MEAACSDFEMGPTPKQVTCFRFYTICNIPYYLPMRLRAKNRD